MSMKKSKHDLLIQEIGAWEIHTKGVGSKILMKFNWQKGQSLSKNSDGIIMPLMKINRQFDDQTYPIFKEVKSVRDFRKLQLINDIDDLLNDTKSDVEMQLNRNSPRLEYFYFADLLIRDMSELTLSAEPILVEVGKKL